MSFAKEEAGCSWHTMGRHKDPMARSASSAGPGEIRSCNRGTIAEAYCSERNTHSQRGNRVPYSESMRFAAVSRGMRVAMPSAASALKIVLLAALLGT